MNSYRQNNSNKGVRSLVVATIFILLIFCIDFVSGGVIRTWVRDVGSALWEHGAGIGNSVAHSGGFSSRTALAQENAALRAEVAQLQDAAAANNATQSENDQLRALTHLASTAPGITAPIISSFRSSPYGTFMIGAGSADTVQQGALVLTSDGFIIGRVADLSAHTALVSELFAPGQSLDVLVDSIPISLQGEGGATARGQAPHGATIAVGESVVAPSLGQRAVGVVGDVESTAASPATDVLVRLPVNLESLSFVYVETVQ
jgi:cell shape-determining protein MreC